MRVGGGGSLIPKNVAGHPTVQTDQYSYNNVGARCTELEPRCDVDCEIFRFIHAVIGCTMMAALRLEIRFGGEDEPLATGGTNVTLRPAWHVPYSSPSLPLTSPSGDRQRALSLSLVLRRGRETSVANRLC